MSWRRWTNRAEEPVEIGCAGSALKQALGDFKASVHAWSDAAYQPSAHGAEVVVRRSGGSRRVGAWLQCCWPARSRAVCTSAITHR